MSDARQSVPAVGRYREFEILQEVGSGSFAKVYKVRAPGHKEPLALKLASNTRLAPDTIKRAIREVAILRSLTNPHVAKLHGSSVGPDHFYVLMDYLEGKQLDRFHRFDDPMPSTRAVDIILQACMGLAEAHAQGVVHRDIKPANIWIQGDGTVKLLDFGLARAWGVPWAYGTNATAARTVVGTPHYCQPEQLVTDQLTPASDVYSLATILYELLCGHAVLFEGQRVTEVVDALRDNPIAWLDAHAMRAVVPITNYLACTDLPPSLVDLLDAALAKEPRMRPADAGIFASRLGHILHHDLGAVAPARLRFLGGGPEDDPLLLPGRTTLGSGPQADIVLSGLADAHAILDWSGWPRLVQIRPVGSSELAREGEPVRAPVDLEPGDVVSLGRARFLLLYPE